MTIREVVSMYLKARGFEGLCNTPAECGCGLDDLMACGHPHETDCAPAYVEPCDGNCVWGCDAGEPHYVEKRSKL